MRKKGILNLSCSEAAGLCGKAEYREANFFEKVRLKIHLFLCKSCKRYYERSHKLSSLLQKADIHTCSAREKENFKEKIRNYQSDYSKENKKKQP